MATHTYTRPDTLHVTLPRTTVAEHRVHHWRQGYLCCFGSPCQMPFVGASPSSTFADAGTHTFHVRAANARAHTDTARPCTLMLARGHPRTHINTRLLYVVTKAPHAQANPHHPWVMNNICLSIPPSLPLAWLLASSWLHCHNVILSASLSPITKMCSDNRPFFFFFFLHAHTGRFPHIRPGPGAAARTEAG